MKQLFYHLLVPYTCFSLSALFPPRIQRVHIVKIRKITGIFTGHHAFHFFDIFIPGFDRLAGTPAAIQSEGMSLVTTDPAPMKKCPDHGYKSVYPPFLLHFFIIFFWIDHTCNSFLKIIEKIIYYHTNLLLIMILHFNGQANPEMPLQAPSIAGSRKGHPPPKPPADGKSPAPSPGPVWE